MLTKLRLVFTTTIVFLSFYASAQSKYWEKETARNTVVEKVTGRFNIKEGKVFSFREKLFRHDLKSVSTSKSSSRLVYFPNKGGKTIAFRVQESPVLSPILSEKYPEIKSYTGYAMDGSGDKVRFSISHNDVQAMIVHADGSARSFVQKASDNKYVLYSRGSMDANDSDFICLTKDKFLAQYTNISAKPVNGQVLRKYRLAISATGEYTAYHGGTVADALAAMNATLTRINEVFETDLAVKLELVGDTDKIIYTDANTDPFSGSLGSMGSEGQNTLTAEIGAANYDIGHVFHKGENSGNAGSIGSICIDNRKGSAYSSGQVPEGDVFDLDFAAHEIGHQLGANHTWSHELEGTLVQVEPGSGSTIMGYAGITTDDNVQPHGDDYFHYVSIEQIIENLNTKSCGEVVPITNNPPAVMAIDDYVIPKSTAFVLTGNATDSDVDDLLSYTWEQIDNGVVTRASFGPTNPSGANFRSRPPNTKPIRYFPLLSRVIDGSLSQTDPDVGSAWETVSEVEREMNFAFTVRDNAAGGGQVVSELVNVGIMNSAGPFVVTSQTVSESYVAGDTHAIEWDVAGTNISPINTATVDIMLSTDGGLTFPVVLAAGVNNDGSHEIIIPGLPTTEARIMVKPADNIYYAVNSADFTIEASEVVLNFSSLAFEVCHFDDLTVPFIYETYLGFDEEVTFSVENVPENLGASFTPNTIIEGNSPIDLLFENTENVPEGSYAIQILATSASITKQVTLSLNIYDTDFPDVIMTAPSDGLMDASTIVPLQWEDSPSHTSFEVQIATDAVFANIVQVATVNTNSYAPTELQSQTTYFWRVKPQNVCGEGTFNTPFSFTTIQVSCDTKKTRGLPLTISSFGTPTITSKIVFFEDLPITDVNVKLNISHTFLADLVVILTSPQGTKVTLISNSCGDLQNVDATFDDEAESFICGADSGTAISGIVKPLGSLSSLIGESILGEWILEVVDNASSDGGALNDFSLDICVEGELRPDADNDGVFDDGDDLCLDTPEDAEVDAGGCQIFRFPNDNFSVSVQSESCRNNDDGAIEIDAMLPLDYVVTVVGNGLNVTDDFTTTFLLPGLNSGTYTLCINASDVNVDYEEHCFEVTVVQPEPLGVTSKISEDGKQVILSMEGGEFYTIEFNDESFRTEKSEITLDLKSGNNALKVSTNLSCQGVFEDELFVSERPIVFPNPFDNVTKVFLNTSKEDLIIDIFTPSGQLIKSKRYVPNGREVDLDFVGLPSGIYFVKLKGKTVEATAKVIKR